MSRLAVYTDTDDLDPSAGIELLKAAGFEVVQEQQHLISQIAALDDSFELTCLKAPCL